MSGKVRTVGRPAGRGLHPSATHADRLRRVEAAAAIGTWEWDLDTDQLWWSDEVYRLTGLPRTAELPSGQAMLDIVVEDDHPSALAPRTSPQGQDCRRIRVRRPDGSVVHLESRWRTVSEFGRPSRVVGTVRDVTEQVDAAALLRRTEESLGALADDGRDAVARVDDDGVCRYANDAAHALHGAGPQELVGTLLRDAVHPDDLPVVARALWRAGGGAPVTVAHRVWNTVEGWIPVETRLRVLVRPDGRDRELQATSHRGAAPPGPSGLGTAGATTGTGTDTGTDTATDLTGTDRNGGRRAGDPARRDASDAGRLTDPLTGVGTRVLLAERLRAAANRSRARRDAGPIGLLMIDLDRYVDVTDTYGQLAGDALLAQVALTLRHVIRPADTLVRFGGSTFVVLVEELACPEQAGDLADGIVAVLAGFTASPDAGIPIGASVGVVVTAGPAGTTMSQLVQQADLALHEAHRRGGGRSVVFAPRLKAAAERRMADESLLREALAQGWLQLHLQPIVEVDGGRVRGAEALVRIQVPGTGELVGPERFIGIAEETGLVRELDHWVLERVVRTIAGPLGWAGGQKYVSVNVSSTTLAEGDYPQRVAGLLRRYGVPPERLVLEITERVLVLADEPAGTACRELVATGVRLAVDDFGSGWSSLAYLGALPLHLLKVDSSLTRTMDTEQTTRAIVTSVVELAHRLGMGVVAEGIETTRQVQRLHEMGCDALQGFVVSPALPLADFRALVARGTD